MRPQKTRSTKASEYPPVSYLLPYLDCGALGWFGSYRLRTKLRAEVVIPRLLLRTLVRNQSGQRALYRASVNQSHHSQEAEGYDLSEFGID